MIEVILFVVIMAILTGTVAALIWLWDVENTEARDDLDP